MRKTVDYTWVSYTGTARIVLAIILLIAAAAVLCAATRLYRPIRLPRAGRTATEMMVVAWLLAILVLVSCVEEYGKAMHQHHLLHSLPSDPIAPVTGACVVVTFAAILVAARSHGRRVQLASAAIGAMVAPMVFEFPFDLIVMARTYPPIPPDPALYRLLFFAPLFVVELGTLALLTLLPDVRLRRLTLCCLALMLGVFAVWALTGFGYPATTVPFAFNALSKVLAFATALTLFLPERSGRGTSRPAVVLEPVASHLGGQGGHAGHPAGAG